MSHRVTMLALAIPWLASACAQGSEATQSSRAVPGVSHAESLSVPTPDLPPTHYLDPLTADEIRAAVEAVSASHLSAARGLVMVSLGEQPKPTVTQGNVASGLERHALATIVDADSGRTLEATVNLTTGTVSSVRTVTDGQAPILAQEASAARRLIGRDQRWLAALRRRQLAPTEVTQSLQVHGDFDPRAGRRIRVLAYRRDSSGNRYARPIEGLMAIVNATSDSVERVIDVGSAPIPAPAPLADSALRVRGQLKPLHVTQPEGPSLVFKGREIHWDDWRFRVALYPREGLVLYAVALRDGDDVRSVVHRANLSEMLVPYAAPDSTWHHRAAFDVGDYLIGGSTQSMQPGRDAPDNAVFLDAVIGLGDRPVTIPRAIALYERDGGLLWRHGSIAHRARQLVVRVVYTVGNYDYAQSWILHQDGTLECEVDLSGIMFVKATAAKSHASLGPVDAATGHLVAPNLIAVHHQHFFSFRIDLDVDGVRNSVWESNSRSIPLGRRNPHGNAFAMEETQLRTERAAARDASASTSRTWRIENSEVLNALGSPVGFILLAGETSSPYMAPSASARVRGGFVNHHFWVTKHDPGQLHAAGAYPNQGRGGDGLPRWIADDQPLVDSDVVIWYTLGTTHIPRPEEWPVMPAARASFRLRPSGFFSRNRSFGSPPVRRGSVARLSPDGNVGHLPP